jgi:hypothetical protein
MARREKVTVELEPGLRKSLARWAREETSSAMNRACQVHTTGLARPDRRMISAVAAAIGCGKDDLGAPHMLLGRAAIRDDRLKTTAISSGNVDDNSCSHDTRA